MGAAYLKVLGAVSGVRQACGKAQFASRAMARNAARQRYLTVPKSQAETLVKMGTGTLAAYKCPICGGEVWHIGHR